LASSGSSLEEPIVDQKDRKNLNEIAIELSKTAGQQVLKVPGVTAVLITLVGTPDIPLGVIIYDKQHQTAETLLAAISRLSSHIDVIVGALAGDQDGKTSHGRMGQQAEVRDESDDGPHAHEDSPAAPDENSG
jgi:hypothetical protein